MNKIDKSKSNISIKEEIIKNAKNIFDDFKQFTTGYRVLFLIHRNKEGGGGNNTKVRKIITRNEKEYLESLTELLNECYYSELPLRIYASLNERNFEKAIRQFKYEQLDADYYDQIQKENFYLDIKNRFIGCLIQPAQRKTSYFMFDVDGDWNTMDETLNELPNDLIIKQYKTKNGWHIITQPFNHTKCEFKKHTEFHKDGLLLLHYKI